MTYDGHTYDLVQIGTQCWFKENLRSDNYRNGDPIPGNLNDSQWTLTNSGAQAIYDDSTANLATYGRLYNWYAVDDDRGLCPTGFHVPTDEEWTELVIYLGGEEVAGTKMKSSKSDIPAWDGTNGSGFSALPGGNRRYSNGVFGELGQVGVDEELGFPIFDYMNNWWSSSPPGLVAWSRGLVSGLPNVSRYNSDVRYGFSVRCVRD